jgi:hypothetical protein
MCYEATIASIVGDEAKLVLQALAKMHLFLAVVKKEVLAQFSRVPSGARHRRRFLVLCPVRKGNASQLLPKVPIAQGSSTGSIQQPSHCTSHQSVVDSAFALSSSQTAAQNNARAL